MAEAFRRGGEALLVVHADDLGVSQAVNEGIKRCYQTGMVTSTSMMANGPAFEQACAWACCEGWDVGLHLNFTSGGALAHAADTSRMTNAGGLFPGKWIMTQRLLAGRVTQGAMEREFRAQMERLLTSGLQVAHLDSHHHIHLLPRVAAVVAPLAREYGLRWVRQLSLRSEGRCHGGRGFGAALQQGLMALWASRRYYRSFAHAGHFRGMVWYASRDKQRTFMDLLHSLGSGVNEWMVHPAFHPQTGAKGSIEWHRFEEQRLLCDETLKGAVQQAGIKRIAIRAHLNTKREIDEHSSR